MEARIGECYDRLVLDENAVEAFFDNGPIFLLTLLQGQLGTFELGDIP